MFYRIKVPLEELARHDGYEVTLKSAGDQGDGDGPTLTGRDMEGYDVVIAQRFNYHRGLQVWRRARTPFNRLVYETDDDIFTVTPENWAAYQLYSDPEVQDAIMHSAETSDLITVTTPHLAQVMRERSGNASVAVLPNCVPGWVLDLPRDDSRRLCIGWAGGASHGADIGITAGPARRFLKRFPDWDFRLHGTDYRPTIGHERTLFASWIAIVKEPEAYYRAIDFDIGLCPLADSEFNNSKSNIKAVEYAARGIPVIASDCEPYRGFVQHGVNGFLVRYEHEWLKYLSELAADDGLREQMGAAARESARELTIERNWQLWAAAYAGLFPRVL